MKHLIVILFVMFNSYNSFACEKEDYLVLSIKYDNAHVQYVKPVQRMLQEVLKKKPNAKFSIISFSHSPKGALEDNYINGIISTMIKYGIEKSQIKIKYDLLENNLGNEIKIMVQ